MSTLSPHLLPAPTVARLTPAPLYFPKGVKDKGLFLAGDVHLGSPQFAEDLFHAEMEGAGERGDRILLGGDLIDGIIPRDKKRFTPSCLHPRLQGKDNVLDEAVEWAAESLEPYARHLDVMLFGNHEYKLLKGHSVDVTGQVLERLRSSCNHCPAEFGGYMAFISYRLQAWDGAEGVFTLFATHGSGSSPQKKLSFVEGADVIWSNHTHQRSVVRTQHLTPRGPRDCWRIVTGSYLSSYELGSPESLKGQAPYYAAEALYAPHSLGGVRLVLSYSPDRGFTSRVEIR